MIELKEEIYGNLVARYEDYVAGGMSAEDALEKTKASMTSLDDVLETGQDSRRLPRRWKCPLRILRLRALSPHTLRAPPQPPVQQGAETAPARKHLSPAVIAVIAVAALFVIVILGFMGCNMFVADRAHESYENDQTVSLRRPNNGQRDGQGTLRETSRVRKTRGRAPLVRRRPPSATLRTRRNTRRRFAVDDAIANQDVAVLQQAVGNGTDTAAFVAELPLRHIWDRRAHRRRRPPLRSAMRRL